MAVEPVPVLELVQVAELEPVLALVQEARPVAQVPAQVAELVLELASAQVVRPVALVPVLVAELVLEPPAVLEQVQMKAERQVVVQDLQAC